MWRPGKAELAKIGFTAAYTLVVLPFTVSFFRDIARPPEGARILGLPLDVLHTLTLPLFLGALEWIGVQLACAFWRERRASLLLLFLAAQSFAAFSTFYDVRASEWNGLRERRQAELKPLREQARSLRSQANVRLLSAKVARRKKAELLASDQTLVTDREVPKALVGTVLMRQLSERKQAVAALEAQIRADEREAEAFRVRAERAETEAGNGGGSGQAESPAEHIGRTFLSAGSLLALFVAALFPVTILGVSRLFVGTRTRTARSAALDLTAELDAVAALPEDRQPAFADGLKPYLSMHLLSVRSAKRAAAESAGLHIRHDAELALLEEWSGLKGQILASGLSEEARTRLAAHADAVLSERFDT